MNYSFASAITKTRPALVMESDARGKKKWFVSLNEVDMTDEDARKFASLINTAYREYFS
jgi:hypothetical protein